MGFGCAGLYFCRVGYSYWARGSGPRAVRASKKLARAISSSSVDYFRTVNRIKKTIRKNNGTKKKSNKAIVFRKKEN